MPNGPLRISSHPGPSTPAARLAVAPPAPLWRSGKPRFLLMLHSRDLLVERLETEADLDAVAELEARCFSNPWTREMLARELAQSDVAYVFVLRLPDQPVAAFCSCWIVADELHINTMAVDAPHRRLGLATRLMQHVMTEAARRGAVRATLEVRQSNTAARRLYESLGFLVTAVRPQYYTHPEEDALILWREHLDRLKDTDSWTG